MHPCWDLGLGLPASGSVRDEFLLFMSYLVCDVLLWQPEQNRIPVKVVLSILTKILRISVT